MAESLIVIVEDEEDLLELLEMRLKKAGFEVEGFLNIQNVARFLEEETVDLLLIDRNLPGTEGATFVQSLRQKGCKIPVIFLTAKSSDAQKLEGFALGGDDYITKPFKFDELIARIRAVLKRTRGSAEPQLYTHRDLTLNMDTREVHIKGEKIELTRLEFLLLAEFIKNHDILLTREELRERIWSHCDHDFQDKSINVAVKRLREKIDPHKEKRYFRAVRGEGYILR